MMKSICYLATLAVFCPLLNGVVPAASEVAEAAKDVVGAWRLEFTTPENETRKPIVLVGRQYEEFAAWYVEESAPESFQRVRLDGETLLLTIRPQARRDVEVTFKAQQAGENACAGEAVYRTNDGDTGSFPFKGKRVDPSEFDDTSRWEVRFTIPDGESLTAMITVFARGDHLYGWYASRDLDQPMKEVKRDGDNVSMSMATKMPDGSKLDVVFRGLVDGDRVTGDIEYSVNGDRGSIPFTGKRKS